jgi:hypothetical protein
LHIYLDVIIFGYYFSVFERINFKFLTTKINFRI